MANVGNVVIGVTLGTAGLNAAMNGVKGLITNRLSQAAAEGQRSFETRMTEAGQTMTVALTAPITAAMGMMAKLASQYEDAVAKVYTIMDKTAMSRQEMSQNILDLSTKTGKSAEELSEATYQALSASVETEKVAGFVEQSVKLARAGFLDTAGAVDVLTTIINAYGYTAEDAEMISGRLVQTQNKGKTTVNELASSMGQVIPTAAAYNVSLDNLSSAYVIMTKQGINTANATTMINGMLSELSNQGSDVAKILKEKTGKTFGQLMEDGMNLGEVLEILNDSVKGNSEEFANLWSNIRAGKGALALANGGAEEFTATMGDMANSATLVDEALEELDTASYKVDVAINAVKNTGVLLGQELLEFLLPAIEAVEEGTQGLYEWMANTDEETKQLILKVAGLVAAVGPLLVVGARAIVLFGKAQKSLALFTTAIGGTAKALTLLKAGAVIAGAALVAFAIYNVAKYIKHQQELKNVGNDLRKSLANVKDETNKLADAQENATKSLRDGTDAFKANTQAVEDMYNREKELIDLITESNTEVSTQSGHMDRWREALEKLNGATDLTEEQQGLLLSTIDDMNASLGTNYKVVQDDSGAWIVLKDGVEQSTQALLDYIEAQEIEMRLSSTRDQYKAAYEAEQKSLQDLTEERSKLNAIYNEYHALQVEYDEADQAGKQKIRAELFRLEEAYGKQKELVDELGQGHQAEKETVDVLAREYGLLARAHEDGASKMEKFIASNDNLLAGFRVGKGDVNQFIADLEELGVTTEDLASLTDEQLADLASSYMNSLDDIEGKLHEFSGEAPRAMQDAASNIRKTRDEFADSGEYAAGGMAEGIYRATSKVADAAREMVKETLKAAKSEAGQGSPWKTTQQMGVYGAEGLAEGLEKGTSEAVSAAQKMVSSVLSATQIQEAMSSLHLSEAQANLGLSMFSTKTAPSSNQSESQSTVWNIGTVNVQAENAQDFVESMRRLAVLGAM